MGEISLPLERRKECEKVFACSFRVNLFDIPSDGVVVKHPAVLDLVVHEWIDFLHPLFQFVIV
jgi:hypothetical protein